MGKNNDEYQKKIDRIRELIGIELDLCDKYKTPYVCAEASDPVSRAKITELILNICLKSEGKMSVDDAIDQYERTFNPNMIWYFLINIDNYIHIIYSMIALQKA